MFGSRYLLWLPVLLIGISLSFSQIPAQTKTSPAEIEIQFPLQRKAYQTNEWIELAVTRTGPALEANQLSMKLRDAQGGHIDFQFAITKYERSRERNTEHLGLNGRLLRPGKYTLELTANGISANAEFELSSHIRQSSFRLVDWGSHAKGSEQALLGETSLGFNTLLASYGGLSIDDTIRAGLDYMWCCTMGGGHQMDLRKECDWSDPLVVRGGTARAVRRALMDRTNPNCIGVHFYDEPGLTWSNHPKTGEFGPHNIPAQDRAYRFSFGKEPLQYNEVKPDNPQLAKEWMERGRWKLSFLEAAWKNAAEGVKQVRSDFLCSNQASYGWNAYTDGYYFNILRCLPIFCGHGGYDDYGAYLFNPSFAFEFGRMRDTGKPHWYLPTWYIGLPSNRFRAEQNLSFMMGLQGIMKPPDMKPHRPITQGRGTTDGIVETNKFFGKFGTIFTTSTITKPPVAILYSMSQNLASQVKDMKDNYDGNGHRNKCMLCYLAAKQIQQNLYPIVEEDVLDGTMANQHRAVLLPGIDYLEANVQKALEDYISCGGTVLISDESKIQIQGAKRFGMSISTSYFDQITKAYQTNKAEEIAKLANTGRVMEEAKPIAQKLKERFTELQIHPPLESSDPSIIVSQHSTGDVEYLFAVNTAYDAKMGEMNSIRATKAELGFRGTTTIYDLQTNKPLTGLATKGDQAILPVSFGPGQLRMFARSTRPIGKVQVISPHIDLDLTRSIDPIRLSIRGMVLDSSHRVLSASIPLEIEVRYPSGEQRYHLYRATKQGMIQIDLPLAANDPAGEYSLTIRELLSNQQETITFSYKPPVMCPALAGTSKRAVVLEGDKQNIYRFFQTFKEVTLVPGKGDYAEMTNQLSKMLQSLGIHSKVVPAESINRPRPISEEEAKTWVGLQPGKVNPGDKNDPVLVGFAVNGPVVLIGSPDDNPLIAFLQKWNFLPFAPNKTHFPGNGRAMLAWQRDGIRLGEESITLISYDAEGRKEALGSLFDVASALEPLTPRELPLCGRIQLPKSEPTKKTPVDAPASLFLPDRVIRCQKKTANEVLALCQDGSIALIQPGMVQIVNSIPELGDEIISDSNSQPDQEGEPIKVALGRTIWTISADGSKVEKEEISFPHPQVRITMFCSDPKQNLLIVAGSDGSLQSLKDKKWNIAGVKKEQMNQAIPYLRGRLTTDGNRLIAQHRNNELHIMDMNDGKILNRFGGIPYGYDCLSLGEEWITSDMKHLIWFSVKDGKEIRRIRMPSDVGLFTGKSDALYCSREIDGTLRKLVAPSEKTKEQILWEHAVPGHIVKQIANHTHLAIAYWGGRLDILNPDGKLASHKQYDQDITHLIWLGDQLLVFLADGKIRIQ